MFVVVQRVHLWIRFVLGLDHLLLSFVVTGFFGCCVRCNLFRNHQVFLLDPCDTTNDTGFPKTPFLSPLHRLHGGRSHGVARRCGIEMHHRFAEIRQISRVSQCQGTNVRTIEHSIPGADYDAGFRCQAAVHEFLTGVYQCLALLQVEECRRNGNLERRPPLRGGLDVGRSDPVRKFQTAGSIVHRDNVRHCGRLAGELKGHVVCRGDGNKVVLVQQVLLRSVRQVNSHVGLVFDHHVKSSQNVYFRLVCFVCYRRFVQFSLLQFVAAVDCCRSRRPQRSRNGNLGSVFRFGSSVNCVRQRHVSETGRFQSIANFFHEKLAFYARSCLPRGFGYGHHQIEDFLVSDSRPTTSAEFLASFFPHRVVSFLPRIYQYTESLRLDNNCDEPLSEIWHDTEVEPWVDSR
mmetsp:Transcript_6024/g.14951  ORF Transcript_6024/g.14951 Transcript_6024/m.14951 type:complete len:404 (-) Transcript_6024:26-1237(-)